MTVHPRFDDRTVSVDGGEDRRNRLVSCRLSSVLAVFARARDQMMIVSFCAEAAHAFDERDVLRAPHRGLHRARWCRTSNWPKRHSNRRTRAHADQLEARVHVLTRELESKAIYVSWACRATWRDVLRRRRRSRERILRCFSSGNLALGRKSWRDSFFARRRGAGSLSP